MLSERNPLVRAAARGAALILAGVCPSEACRPGLQPSVCCDRDVDPETGEHLDGAKMHRGHDGTGDALWG